MCFYCVFQYDYMTLRYIIYKLYVFYIMGTNFCTCSCENKEGNKEISLANVSHIYIKRI